MGVRESLHTVREYLMAAVTGSSPIERAVDDASSVSRQHRPFGPEATPDGLPWDIPVLNAHGFRHRPRAAVSRYGDVSVIYVPRCGFDDVTAYYRTELAGRRWTVTEVHNDSGPGYRARRFDVEKGTRAGSVAIEETVEDLGVLERRVVTVSVDIPQWD